MKLDHRGEVPLFVKDDSLSAIPSTFTVNGEVNPPNQLTEKDLEGITKLVGRGIYYSPLSVDAPETENERVAIVGGGNSAGQAALHLAQYAKDVTIIIRGPRLEDKMADYLVRRIKAEPKIQVLTDSNVIRAHSDENGLSGITFLGRLAAEQFLDARWLYLLLGGRPNIGWLGKEAAGRIKTSKVSRAVLRLPLESGHRVLCREGDSILSPMTFLVLDRRQV